MTSAPDIFAEIANIFGNGLKQEDVRAALSDQEAAYLRENWRALETLEDIWAAMDAEWARTGAGYSPAEAAALGEFYASPVWLMNGIFTEIDPESQGHRMAIADYVAGLQPRHVADYGGGFGAFSRLLRQKLPDATIEVIEPYPTRLGLALAEKSGISYASELPPGADVVTAQDVLEHVTDPLDLMGKLLAPLAPGALVITANCFKPVIKCHYPGAYHFNFTFRHVAVHLGCDYVESVPGADHAEVYQKTGRKPDWRKARMLEGMSSAAHPLMKLAQRAKRALAGS